MAALLLALVAAMTPFVAEHNSVYAQEVATPSSLSNLTLSVGTLGPFAWNDYEYDTKVPSRTSSVRVTATPNILGSQVKIYTSTAVDSFTPNAGSMIDPASPNVTLSGTTVSLTAGTITYIGIEVTALDDDVDDNVDPATSVYQIQVERIPSGASSDATLMAFNLGVANTDPTVSPDFDKDVTSYTALVPNDTEEVTVVATVTSNSGAAIELKSDKDSTIANNMVMLSVGVNVITAKVTAANLEATKTYTLRVTKAAANASDDARLRSLSLSGITLSPTFKSSEPSYTARYPIE